MGGPQCFWKLQKDFKQGLSCCRCRFQTLTLEVASRGPDGVSGSAGTPQLCARWQAILPWSRHTAWGLGETRQVCRLHGFRPGCGDPGPVRVAFLEHRGPPKASNPSSSSQRTGERVLPSVLCALRLGFFDTPPQLLQLKPFQIRVPPLSWKQPEHKAGCFRSLIESSEPQVLFCPLLSSLGHSLLGFWSMRVMSGCPPRTHTQHSCLASPRPH